MVIIKAMAALELKNKLVEWNYEASDDLKVLEVFIEIKHCGICYSDIHMIDNDWNISQYPLVPGHEIIGKVKEIGTGVTHIKPGDTVGIGWQRSSCSKCIYCIAGDDSMCSASYPERKSTIVQNYGGFATHIVFDSRFVFPVPSNLDLKKTAPLLCGGITSYSALKEAGMTSGKNIGVIGMGGLGHMAVQFASRLGNKVTVFSRTDSKTELSYKLGADNVVLTKEGVPRKIDDKLDIIINTVDRQMDWENYIKLLGVDGTLTFVGNPGKIEINIGLLLSKRKRITGSLIGGRARITEMLDISAKYGIGAIIEEFSLSQVNKAIDKLKANEIRFRGVLNI